MERIYDEDCVIGFGLGEGLRACQLLCGLGVGDLLQLHRKIMPGK